MLEDYEVKEINLGYDLQDFKNYFEEVEKNFTHLRFDLSSTNKDELGFKDYNLADGYSWAIHSYLADLNVPCPPYKRSDLDNFYRETALMFGPVRKLQEVFPFSYQYSILVAPPGFGIGWHTDNRLTRKLHIPIYSDKKSFLSFESGNKYLLEPGKAYLLNTALRHSTFNEGETNRIHFICTIPVNKINDVINSNFSI